MAGVNDFVGVVEERLQALSTALETERRAREDAEQRAESLQARVLQLETHVEMLLEAHVRQLEERVVPGTVVAGMPIA